jgi:Icc-related predicted phosphoesterase
MRSYNGKLVELPKKGKAFIVTDLHGNLKDFNRYMKLWEKCRDDNAHLILTGDFIHAMGRENDRSIDILEFVKSYWESNENFHPLLGNHEWSTIAKVSVYKAGVNQSLNFEDMLKERFKKEWKYKLKEYEEFFKKLPIAVKTENKVFISHAGPPKNIKNLEDIINIADEGYLENAKLYQILWNRKEDYTEKDIKSFLRAVDCKAMIVGHTPVNGVELIGEDQIVVSSSYTLGKKSYVLLDLEVKIKSAKDILKMVKKLGWFN